MKLNVSVILMMLIGVLAVLSNCATSQAPLHVFDAYFYYDNEGNPIVKKNNEEHICMPFEDFSLFYETYNIHYGIEGE